MVGLRKNRRHDERADWYEESQKWKGQRYGGKDRLKTAGVNRDWEVRVLSKKRDFGRSGFGFGPMVCVILMNPLRFHFLCMLQQNSIRVNSISPASWHEVKSQHTARALHTNHQMLEAPHPHSTPVGWTEVLFCSGDRGMWWSCLTRP